MNNKKKSPYESYIKELKAYALKENEARFAAKQLLTIHSAVSIRKSPIVLELGVDRGQSTKVILNAINNKKNAHLVSVDIRDCSSISTLKSWTFIQMDSTKISDILRQAPILKKGIDIIYVDSLHTKEHVQKEIYGWFPYLKKGGVILLDDIDSGPYMNRQRKDSVSTEIANRNIYELIETIFMSNLNIIDLSFIRGSTGLAIIKKICHQKKRLNPPKILKKRSNIFIWKVLNFIFKRKQYKHSLDTNQSFLIDVTKFKE